MLIDTHSHLYFPEFKDDLSQVLDRSRENNVTTLFTVGVDIKTSQVALDLESDRVKFYSTIGIHPQNAHEYIDDKKLEADLTALEKIYLENPKKVVAVGECGLDYMFEGNRDFVPSGMTSGQLKDLQKKLFKAQLDLAKKLNLPLVIHCRDDRSRDPDNVNAWNDVLEIAGDHYGLLHCYSGKETITQKALDSKFLFSFAATLTYPKNDYLREAVKQIPLTRIALETDCPFLPPQSKRGERNEPTTVIDIAKLIAEIKGIGLGEVANQTTRNVSKLLRFN